MSTECMRIQGLRQTDRKRDGQLDGRSRKNKVPLAHPYHEGNDVASSVEFRPVV